MNGSGCPICGNLRKRSYRNKKTILYYTSIGGLFKIGLTTSSLKKRYYKELSEGLIIDELGLWVFENGDVAFDLEQMILHDFDIYKYNGDKILEGGNTELFETNILEYIKPMIEEKMREYEITNL